MGDTHNEQERSTPGRPDQSRPRRTHHQRSMPSCRNSLRTSIPASRMRPLTRRPSGGVPRAIWLGSSAAATPASSPLTIPPASARGGCNLLAARRGAPMPAAASNSTNCSMAAYGPSLRGGCSPRSPRQAPRSSSRPARRRTPRARGAAPAFRALPLLRRPAPRRESSAPPAPVAPPRRVVPRFPLPPIRGANRFRCRDGPGPLSPSGGGDIFMEQLP